MKEVKATWKCDLCKREVKGNEFEKIKYPVLFTTDQTEGRFRTPYISYENIDLCEDCVRKVIKIEGAGAQGYNRYTIIDKIEHEKIELDGEKVEGK